MAGTHRSTQITRGTLDAHVSIASGETCYVGKISVANATGAQAIVHFDSADGLTELFTWVVPANDTHDEEIDVVMDKGIRVRAIPDVNVTVNVFHGAGAA